MFETLSLHSKKLQDLGDMIQNTHSGTTKDRIRPSDLRRNGNIDSPTYPLSPDIIVIPNNSQSTPTSEGELQHSPMAVDEEVPEHLN